MRGSITLAAAALVEGGEKILATQSQLNI